MTTRGARQCWTSLRTRGPCRCTHSFGKSTPAGERHFGASTRSNRARSSDIPRRGHAGTSISTHIPPNAYPCDKTAGRNCDDRGPPARNAARRSCRPANLGALNLVPEQVSSLRRRSTCSDSADGSAGALKLAPSCQYDGSYALRLRAGGSRMNT